MLHTIRDCLVIVLLVILCIGVIVVVRDYHQLITDTDQHLNHASTIAYNHITAFQQALAEDDRKFNRIMRDGAVIMNELGKASTQQKKYVDVSLLTLEKTNQALDSFNDMINHGNATFVNVNARLNDVGTLVNTWNATGSNVNAILTNPDLTGTLKNTGRITFAFAGMAEDFQHWVHPRFNPEQKKLTKAGILWKTMQFGVSALSPTAEFMYYIKGIQNKQ